MVSISDALQEFSLNTQHSIMVVVVACIVANDETFVRVLTGVSKLSHAGIVESSALIIFVGVSREGEPETNGWIRAPRPRPRASSNFFVNGFTFKNCILYS